MQWALAMKTWFEVEKKAEPMYAFLNDAVEELRTAREDVDKASKEIRSLRSEARDLREDLTAIAEIIGKSKQNGNGDSNDKGNMCEVQEYDSTSNDDDDDLQDSDDDGQQHQKLNVNAGRRRHGNAKKLARRFPELSVAEADLGLDGGMKDLRKTFVSLSSERNNEEKGPHPLALHVSRTMSSRKRKADAQKRIESLQARISQRVEDSQMNDS